MKTKLIKIKRGLFNGSGTEYQYGSKVLITSRSNGYTYVFEKGNTQNELMRSLRYEDYRPFMKRFRLHLEKTERDLITK
jgi:hypothetical protein